LDRLINSAEASISKLKLIRTGFLHDLLTRGIDENGKLRDPITNPDQFNNTSLGLLPKEWKISRLGLHATHLTSGSRGWASHYSREGSIFLRIGNLTREHINLHLDDVIRVRPPPGSEGERTRTQPQDILISITADLGIIGVIPDGFPEAFVNQDIALVRPASSLVARWTARFLGFGPAAKHLRLLNDSGAKAGMSLPSVESLLIAIPSPEEQREASRLLDELDDSIAREERITEKLIAMKRGLVDDILTGRVRIPPDLLDANS
jgi:type I restriction enzyme S subunit